MSESPAATSEALAKRLDKLYEFEREPVREDKLQGGRRFAALFAGEHVAATEFVIGALFVQWGASTRDVVYGLLLGNLLAVLSWALICAPIAVQVRVTLYWYARRIIGPGLTVIYNIVNAMLYCCLAAAMIGVSASAVIRALGKIGWTLQHPALTDKYPNSIGWVVVVLLVGAVVITLAILGFKKLSQFSSVCSPWMFMVFIAGGLATLPKLGDFSTPGELWTIAETKVWTGEPYEDPVRLVTSALPGEGEGLAVPPALREELSGGKTPVALSEEAALSVVTPGARWTIEDGKTEYVIRSGEVGEGEEKKAGLVLHKLLPRLFFWHLVFFAWFANLAMHVGLSDMALFRYARRWTYGFYSAIGMYLGHFLAWICAGIMGAAAAAALNPGEMADLAAGMAGMIAVLIAGWTTANPTIYRAGLALQIVTPNWPRWLVTFAAGLITTIIAFFPAIFMKLLDFVAIYGLTLMPIGAVIFVEHWLFPRWGLTRYWTEKRKLLFNPAAVIAWVVVLVLCFPIEQFTGGVVKSPMELLDVHLFFRWLPGWFIAAGLYAVLAAFLGARIESSGDTETPPAAEPPPPAADSASVEVGMGGMSRLGWAAGATAVLSLVLCLVLPLTVFFGSPENYDGNMEAYKRWFLVVTVLYFIAAITWAAEREKVKSKSEVT